MTEIYTRTMAHEADEAYKINARTAILDCERLGKPLTIHTFTRRFLTPYKCIDTPNEPITLKGRYNLHGGLIYYKKNDFEWRTISFDDISSIYTE